MIAVELDWDTSRGDGVAAVSASGRSPGLLFTAALPRPRRREARATATP
jgi:hypothetical protein